MRSLFPLALSTRLFIRKESVQLALLPQSPHHTPDLFQQAVSVPERRLVGSVLCLDAIVAAELADSVVVQQAGGGRDVQVVTVNGTWIRFTLLYSRKISTDDEDDLACDHSLFGTNKPWSNSTSDMVNILMYGI